MAAWVIIVIAFSAVLFLLLLAGYAVSHRRVQDPEVDRRIRDADRALEQARAGDRGWDRALMVAACEQAIRDRRPDHQWEAVDLVLVDDRPGVTEDRAHLVATGPQGEVRVILARREGGDWYPEQVD